MVKYFRISLVLTSSEWVGAVKKNLTRGPILSHLWEKGNGHSQEYQIQLSDPSGVPIVLMIRSMISATQLSWNKGRTGRYHHTWMYNAVGLSVAFYIKSCFAKNKNILMRHMVPGIAAHFSMKQILASDPSALI